MLTQTQQSSEVNIRTFTVALSFPSFQSHCHCCSLLLHASTCHLYQSLSRLTLTGRLLVCFIPPPQQFPSCIWRDGFTSSPLYHSASLLPIFPVSAFPPPPRRVLLYRLLKDREWREDLTRAWDEVTVRCHCRARSPFEKCQMVVCGGGLSVNIMDEWLWVPSASCRAVRLLRCPVCRWDVLTSGFSFSLIHLHLCHVGETKNIL